ncbi:MAG: tetratricopeptide repeat protein [Nitrospira sp.]|nr:tetratricopeptide repeat protein [Nitrospira sp.]
MSSDFEIAHHEAMILFQEGRYNEAERIFLQIMNHRPQGYADIYNKLGFICQWRNEFQKAAEFYQKALDLNPNYTEAALNLAVTYNELGMYEKAVGTFTKAANLVKTHPKSIDPYIRGRLANEHARLGDLYYAMGLYEDALDEYRKALTLRPNLVDIMNKIGITLRDQGSLDEAIRIFMRAKEVHPRYSQAFIHLGITYYMKGFVDMARKEWESLKEVDPNNHEANLYLALAQKEEHE